MLNRCNYCSNISNKPQVAAGGPCEQTYACRERAKEERQEVASYKAEYMRQKAERKAEKNRRREGNLAKRSQESQDHAAGKDKKVTR